MKTVLACVLVALCVCSLEAKPWGKFINISVNKQYDGPNFADILSRLVRQKMDFKNSLWNSFMSAKTQSYNYNYNAQPYFTKTITINSNAAPAKSNKDCNKDVNVDVEVITQPPIPMKMAPLVQHEKTFEFNGSFSSGSSTHAASTAGSSSSSSNSGSLASSQYLPPKESGRSNSDSDLVSIRELQKENE